MQHTVSVSFNSNPELLDKVTYLAEISLRTKNAMIKKIVEEYLNEYEKEHGPINLLEKEK